MATAPYGVRLLVGAAVTALEETRRLPQTVITYPMTIVSQFAQLVMKMQQDVADLVNRGDETLDHLFPPKDEQPEWATFDEDDDESDDGPSGPADDDGETPRNGERLTEGRFALYSTGEPEARDAAQPAPTVEKTPAPAPGVVAELDYESLTLAQLRARLPSLKVPDLEALLAFEEATKGRAPFQTLIANRITRASAK
ncbi:lipid droplet-associated protein [Mycolicibacterium sp. P1-18]|uniref:lipid droplet-associated protein n=1 Tax=Mycolicibacterium sp. P1-18 TaxID=2024615 RepID=UPI0011F18F52|nr:lipid droplet-associated protein [Mycolicibacterium sp. P1-18]KAA0095394.1 lipid droplet-associated protein [Mycolicibacterium sp. P1-18]